MLKINISIKHSIELFCKIIKGNRVDYISIMKPLKPYFYKYLLSIFKFN